MFVKRRAEMGITLVPEERRTVHVGWQSGNWIAQICGRPGIRSAYIGSFDSEIEAAHAYDRAAIEWFGEFASLNFPRKEGALR